MIPDAAIPKVGGLVMDLQDPTKKMSKSRSSPQGKVLLLEPPEAITKKIKRAVTDNDAEVRYDREAKPGVANLLELLSVSTGESPEALAGRYEQYGPLKADTAAAVVELLRPVQTRVGELLADQGYIEDVLAKGAVKAQAVAAETLARARDAMGFLPRRSVVVGGLEDVAGALGDRPPVRREVVLPGPGDGAGVGARPLEEVAADGVVTEVAAEPAVAVVGEDPVAGDQAGDRGRHAGDRRQLRRHLAHVVQEGRRDHPGWLPSGVAATVRATPTAWRRSGPLMRAHSSCSPSPSRRATHASSSSDGPRGSRAPKNRRARWARLRHVAR